MQQRLGLAMALVQDPDVLVPDGPVSALDPIVRHDIVHLLSKLKRDRCVIMSTHILDDAERVCDDVVIMRDGMNLMQQSMDTLLADVSPRYNIELNAEPAAVEKLRRHRGRAPFALPIVPLVFLLLGVAQPITFHFMPELLQQAGLPEGMTIEIPPVAPVDIIAGVLDQLNQVGVLTVILVAMGLFGREIESGVAGFMGSLGISRFSYFAAKWSVLAGITLASTVLAVLGAAYYTDILFEPVPWGPLIYGALIYFQHLAFITQNTYVARTLAMSVSAIGLTSSLLSVTTAIVAPSPRTNSTS